MISPPAFHVMLKPNGPICNLNCAYCYYLSKERLYPDGRFRMTGELLEEVTRQYIGAQRVPEVTFGWQGGEPLLMGVDFFRRAVELQDLKYLGTRERLTRDLLMHLACVWVKYPRQAAPAQIW